MQDLKYSNNLLIELIGCHFEDRNRLIVSFCSDLEVPFCDTSILKAEKVTPDKWMLNVDLQSSDDDQLPTKIIGNLKWHHITYQFERRDIEVLPCNYVCIFDPYSIKSFEDIKIVIKSNLKHQKVKPNIILASINYSAYWDETINAEARTFAAENGIPYCQRLSRGPHFINRLMDAITTKAITKEWPKHLLPFIDNLGCKSTNDIKVPRDFNCVFSHVKGKYQCNPRDFMK